MMRKLTAMMLAVLMLLCAGTALADDTITVTGKATVQLEPDLVNVTLGVTATNEDVLIAQQEVNAAMNAVIAALTGEELAIAPEDIATTQYRIDEEYEYNSLRGSSEKIGYTAVTMLTICVRDIDKAGLVIDAAMQAGANQLRGVEFGSSDQTGARDQALTLAVQDGMRKAKVIAAAAGVELPALPSAIVEHEVHSYSPAANTITWYEAAADMAASTSLQAGLLSLTASVSITYEID